jgi:copper chaperone CopZ
MSNERQMKKIDMETLEQAERKISLGKYRKLGFAVLIVLVLAGGGYAAFRMMTGSIVASRFAVNKMVCPACVTTVKEVTSKVPGVVESDVSLAAQDVIVKYREKQVSPDQIREAIAKAGYPVKLDGLFRDGALGINDQVVATVNGKPVFQKELDVSFYGDKSGQSNSDPAAAFFSVVGKDILLQIADSKMVIVQPQEVETEVAELAKEKGEPTEEFTKKAASKFGSQEKYFQIVAQRIGIRKLIDEHVANGAADPEQKNHKTLEWVGSAFKDADVKIVDSGTRQKLHAAVGQDEWKTFWPRMIGSQTDLKSLLIQ